MELITLFKKRRIWLFIGFFVVLALFFSLSHFEVFPCETFIWDSSQGNYFSFCALVDEDWEFLFPGDDYYGPMVTIWTWLSAFGVFAVLPYFAAVGVDHIWIRRKTQV